jgi:hypothetical protein
MSDTIQSAEELAEEITPWVAGRGIRYEQHERGIKATAELIESDRAAHIALGREMERTARADEARKQAKRYAACIEDIKSRINLDKDTFSACGRSTVGHFRSLMLIDEALADLEAPK